MNTESNKPTIISKLFGFRSNKIWKKAISVIYAICSIFILLGNVLTIDSANDGITALMILALAASPYIFLSDFKLREYLPLFKKKKAPQSFLGMICVFLIIIILFSLINPATYCEHNWVEQEKKEATCTEDGYINYYCELCDSTNTEQLPKIGHSFKIKEDTDDKTVKECTNCGEILTDEKNNSNTSSDTISDQSSSADSSADNSSKDESTPSTEESSQTSSSASTPSSTSSSYHTHSYSAATCTTPKTCSDCGATTGNANGHSWKAATCTVPKTCSSCGVTTGSTKGHSWTEATYTKPQTCSSCGATEGSSLPIPNEENYHGHVYTGGSSSEKYHYEAQCPGKNSHEISWDDVSRLNLGPCKTCVLQ